MKPIYSLLLIFFAELVFAQEQPMASFTRVYSEDGKLQMLIQFDPGCNCRNYTEYYASGKIFSTRRFRIDGKREFIDGEEKSFYPDGKVKHVKNWKQALPDGKAVYHYANGQIAREEYYEGKYKAGVWKFYSEKGELVKEKVYKAEKNLWNKPDSDVVVRHFSSGKAVKTDTIVDGKSSGSAAPGPRPAWLAEKDGAKLFKLRCATCHLPEKDSFGPALKGVTKKRRPQWLEQKIRNSTVLIENGDTEARKLFLAWGKKKHPENDMLDRAQVAAIINYMKTFR